MLKKGWLQQPLLSLVLVISWLLLVDTFTSPGHWLFAVALALVIQRLIGHWWEPLPKIVSWKALLLFGWYVFIDICKGNLQVARMALASQEELQPAFLRFETTLNNDLAIFMLMSAISLSPGSVPTCFNQESGSIEVHVLHCTDEEAQVMEFRQRYEQLLQQVFAC